MNLDNLLDVKKIDTGLNEIFKKTEDKFKHKFYIRVEIEKADEITSNLLSKICSLLFFKIDPNNAYDDIFKHKAQLNNSVFPKIMVDVTQPIQIYYHFGTRQDLLYEGLMDSEYPLTGAMNLNLSLVRQKIRKKYFYLEIVGLKTPNLPYLNEYDFQRSELIKRDKEQIYTKIKDPKLLSQINIHLDLFESIFHYNYWLHFLSMPVSRKNDGSFRSIKEQTSRDLDKIKQRLIKDLRVDEYMFKAGEICKTWDGA